VIGVVWTNTIRITQQKQKLWHNKYYKQRIFWDTEIDKIADVILQKVKNGWFGHQSCNKTTLNSVLCFS
jgi:hypothetical protein